MFLIETPQELRFSLNHPNDDILEALLQHHTGATRVLRVADPSARQFFQQPGTTAEVDGLTVTIHTRQLTAGEPGEDPTFGPAVLAGTFQAEQLHPLP